MTEHNEKIAMIAQAPQTPPASHRTDGLCLPISGGTVAFNKPLTLEVPLLIGGRKGATLGSQLCNAMHLPLESFIVKGATPTPYGLSYLMGLSHPVRLKTSQIISHIVRRLAVLLG